MFDPAAYTVLIVEDERDLQVMVAQHLVDEGYATVQAGSRLDALTYMRTKVVDLVLLDIMMPGFINGLAALKIMRDTSQTSDIPIIMTTALADMQHVTAALKLGATHYLTKPYKLRELTARLEMILSERPRASRGMHSLLAGLSLLAAMLTLSRQALGHHHGSCCASR